MLGTWTRGWNQQKFPGDIYENGAYIGIPLIILLEVYRRR